MLILEIAAGILAAAIIFNIVGYIEGVLADRQCKRFEQDLARTGAKLQKEIAKILAKG